MCTNYRPGAQDFIRETMDVDPQFEYKAEAFPGYDAPIVRKSLESGELECIPARFGLVPFWAKDDQVAKLGRMAYRKKGAVVDIFPTPTPPNFSENLTAIKMRPGGIKHLLPQLPR